VCPKGVQGKGINDGGDGETAAVEDFDGVLEQFKHAGNEFMRGNPKAVQDLFSHREDVTWMRGSGHRRPSSRPCLTSSSMRASLIRMKLLT
jgi:hypothetical protein